MFPAYSTNKKPETTAALFPIVNIDHSNEKPFQQSKHPPTHFLAN